LYHSTLGLRVIKKKKRRFREGLGFLELLLDAFPLRRANSAQKRQPRPDSGFE